MTKPSIVEESKCRGVVDLVNQKYKTIVICGSRYPHSWKYKKTRKNTALGVLRNMKKIKMEFIKLNIEFKPGQAVLTFHRTYKLYISSKLHVCK
uniref:Uncharacterized protein n=1 Tax=Rhizophora mucronata TaxID=61149 RepID=A0A2P2LGB3_RHIMU